MRFTFTCCSVTLSKCGARGPSVKATGERHYNNIGNDSKGLQNGIVCGLEG